MNQELLITLALALVVVILIVLLSIKSNKVKALTSQIQLNSDEYANERNKLEEQKCKLEEELTNRNRQIQNLSTNNYNLDQNYNKLNNSYKELLAEYSPLIDKDKEIEKKEELVYQLSNEFEELNDKYQFSLELHKELQKQIDLFSDTLEIRDYGLYEPKYSFDFPEQYKLELENVYQKQKASIAKEAAIQCRTVWEVGGSKAEGKKMTKQYMKLMLYAFNGECDALIAKVKWNNASKAEDRIRHAFVTINRLGQVHQIEITGVYLQLKLDELHLTYEYELKKYEEKEEQRRIREQMREEEKAQREFERAEKEAEDEERRYQKALDKAKKELGFASKGEMEALNQKIEELEKNLQEAHERKERAISLAQQTKVGHIYVISNIGSFGEDVYKIGMTRRLDPLDRIRELGDASVPFQFDVHAIIYSENAPQLEYELHRRFGDKRINRINGRKEFVKITLDEIETFIKDYTNAEIQFTKLAEAKEYRETLGLLEKLNRVEEPIAEVTKFPESLIN